MNSHTKLQVSKDELIKLLLDVEKVDPDEVSNVIINYDSKGGFLTMSYSWEREA